jgi:hypothetical protein
MNIRIVGAMIPILVLIGSASAHHSYGMFDRTVKVALVGTVNTFEWTNPHSWIILDVVGKDGKTQEWSIETAPPGQLARSGWKRNSLKPGQKVTVIMNPLRSGARGGTLVSVSTADGKVYGDVVGEALQGSCVAESLCDDKK